MYQFQQIPSEAQIRKYLRKIIFGSNIYCPRCWKREVYSDHDRFWCKRCRTRFSLLSHTWLSNLKLPLQTFWVILWYWTQQVPVKQTAKFSKLSLVTIYHWFEVFRSHLPEDLRTYFLESEEEYEPIFP